APAVRPSSLSLLSSFLLSLLPSLLSFSAPLLSPLVLFSVVPCSSFRLSYSSCLHFSSPPLLPSPLSPSLLLLPPPHLILSSLSLGNRPITTATPSAVASTGDRYHTECLVCSV